MKVLLVEDDPKVASYIADSLLGVGHQCITVGDGAAGYREAVSQELDAVILDVMLPELDGFTVLEKLRESGNHTPVLLLSAKSQVEDKVRGLRTGANDYLTKPFAFEELLARFPNIHSTSNPVRIPSNFLAGISELKVSL